jgi:hypothetical protein
MKALVLIFFLVALMAGAGSVLAQPAKQKHFATAEEAATALTEAIRKDDDKAVQAMLGVGWRDLIPGSTGHEDDLRKRYLEAWDANHKIIPEGDDRAYVEAGTTGWRSPLPILKDAAGWYFDVEAGRKEIIAREIGRDEYTVIQTLLAIVDAQRDYVSLNPMKDRAPTYARRLLSSPGKKDGLYWDAKPGEPQSPLGPAVAKAQADGQSPDGHYGYYFRLLYSQGPAAPGRARDYVVNGRMIGGFGVIAWPVRYGDTGVMTFIVNQDGVVYQQDLGPQTAETAGKIVSFKPDKGWVKADMTPP